MTPRIEMIWEDVCAADFSTPDGIRAFTDRARSEYTAEELVTYLDYTSEHQRHCMTNGHEHQFRVQWQAVADEAKDLIALIRGFGAGGIKSPLIETADGGKVIHPCLHDVCDMTTGKPIDELYDQTVVSLRRMAARAMENNATVQDMAKDAKRGADAAESADRKIKAPWAGVGADGGKKMLAAVQDVGRKLDAARGELAAIGANAERGANAAESAERIANETFAAVGGVAQNVGAARNDLVTVNSNVIKAKDAAQAVALEMKDWRKWIAVCVGNGDTHTQPDQEQTTTPPMFAAARDAIYELWQKFNAEPADCEMRDGGLREPGQKRTFAECLECHGADVVYTSPLTGRKFYLSQFCPTADHLQKAVNAARMAKTRTKTAHKRRTPKQKK